MKWKSIKKDPAPKRRSDAMGQEGGESGQAEQQHSEAACEEGGEVPRRQ